MRKLNAFIAMIRKLNSMKEDFTSNYIRNRKLSKKYNEKKKYTPPRSENEQKEMHVKILIGTIVVTVIVFLIAIANQ